MGDPAKKHIHDEPEEILDEEIEIVEGTPSTSQAYLKAVPKTPETQAEKEAREYEEEWTRKYDELGIEKFDPAEFVKPDEGTTFVGKRPARPKTAEEIAEEKRYFESGKDWGTDLDTEHLIRTKTREAVEKATAHAMEKPLSISPEEALTKTGAQLLHEKYGAHVKDEKSTIVETLSGPMAVTSGLQEPHALLIPYRRTKIFGVSSPGAKQGNEYLKNQAGFVIKPSARKKSLHIFMAKGTGEGPYLGDQGAGLANAAIAEAGALMHTEENFHPTTVLSYMNVSVNDLKRKMKIKKQLVPMLAAELDMTKETARLKVASAGSIHCLIINPHTGHVKSAPRQVVEERLIAKGLDAKTREGVIQAAAKKFDLSPENAAKALTVAGGVSTDEFKPDFNDYEVEGGQVVVLVTDELVQSLTSEFKNKEFEIGKYIRDALEKGFTVEEACARIAQRYVSHQKKSGHAESFGLVGLQVPGEVKKPAVEPKKNEKETKAPPLELDFTDL